MPAEWDKIGGGGLFVPRAHPGSIVRDARKSGDAFPTCRPAKVYPRGLSIGSNPQFTRPFQRLPASYLGMSTHAYAPRNGMTVASSTPPNGGSAARTVSAT